jgi:hypothetical protein
MGETVFIGASTRPFASTIFATALRASWRARECIRFMVSKLMGHSSVSFTLDTYTDEWAEAHDDARDALSAMTVRTGNA